MEQFEQEHLDQHADPSTSEGLWLTDALLVQFRKSSRLGQATMAVCLLLGISYAAMAAYFLIWFWSKANLEDFYLLQDGNLSRLFNLFVRIALYTCFFKGVLEGFKAWKQLRICQTDDDALLEGSHRLGKMFRWLTLWGGIYVVSLVIEHF